MRSSRPHTCKVNLPQVTFDLNVVFGVHSIDGNSPGGAKGKEAVLNDQTLADEGGFISRTTRRRASTLA